MADNDDLDWHRVASAGAIEEEEPEQVKIGETLFFQGTAASEIYAPVAGAVTAVNDALAENPGTVNEDAEGAGWFMKIKVADAAEVEKLMDEAAYKAFVEAEG